MATYKLIQDVEADDKLLGPLSLKQFIYALISVSLLFISYVLYTHHVGLLDIFTLPVALVGIFFAYPFGKDQPTEVWAIARLNFILKPRRRIWAQSGFKKLVTITAPKKLEITRTDGLSQTEVKSRLQALANTIDSQGWAIKNIGGGYNQVATTQDSDRLVSTTTTPMSVPDLDIQESEDLFDENANPVAQQMQQLLSASASKRHQELISNLNNMKAEDIKNPKIQGSVTTSPNSSSLESELKSTLRNAYTTSHSSLGNLHTLRGETPLTDLGSPLEEKTPPTIPSTPSVSPVIMNYSRRNDLNINVIARQINRALPSDRTIEVSISH